MKQRSRTESPPDPAVQRDGDAQGDFETIDTRGNLQRIPTAVDDGADGFVGATSPITLRRTASSRREPSAILESAESCVATPPEHLPSELKLSHHATRLYTISYLIFFSILGTLARIGLQVLTEYPGAPITTGVTWANVGGCLLIGFFAEDRNIFHEEWGNGRGRREKNNGNGDQLRQGAGYDGNGNGNGDEDEDEDVDGWLARHKAVKKTIPLYIGLTTGFCGSFTSFSSFILDAFRALSNTLPNPNTGSIAPRNGGYSFMAVLAVILYTLLLCLSSIVVGAHLADGLSSFTPTVPFKFIRKVLDRLVVVLAFGCWIGAIFLAIWPPDRHNPLREQHWRGSAVFPIIFAPLGCLFRFYASIYFNPLIPSFPLGTFLVNMIGTLILGMCFDLQHAGNLFARIDKDGLPNFHHLLGCQILKGVIDGFCGCTTTVSTWIAELHSLDLKHAYRYGLLSIGLGLAFLVVVVGTMHWTIGLAQPTC
ncbi:fluoride export protein [Arthroderma uncinatum]|uniref:fluoride export protein n=1 Tax=Arthroderma uncinatum TaxID=74035 RepID=UPI00144AAF38|nr:fluoride export protein [Arthroderma uncinatum]KAF3483272.1 fluoride export protein [Arthroderma uncinatum]